jgi:adenylylsulfate kinase
MVIVYLFTGELALAASIGVIEVVAKMFLYYLHERGWGLVSHGRHTIKPFVVWFTGIPKSGKTTLAKHLVASLEKKGHRVEWLDGGLVRTVMHDTEFSEAALVKHVRRVGLLASVLERNGVTVVASLVSPKEETREFVRSLCENFTEVYLSTPLEVCEERDPGTLYERARKGLVDNVAGLNAAFEPPENPDLVLDTAELDSQQCLERIVDMLNQKDLLGWSKDKVALEEKRDPSTLERLVSCECD